MSNELLQHLPDMEQYIDVLERLQYISSDRTVQLKGRVASEINTCDSLIVTELIFENVLTQLHPEEIASLLSALLCQVYLFICIVYASHMIRCYNNNAVIFLKDKSEDLPSLPPRLEDARRTLIEIATSLSIVQMECGVDTTPSDFLKQINFSLMEVYIDSTSKKMGGLYYIPQNKDLCYL